MEGKKDQRGKGEGERKGVVRGETPWYLLLRLRVYLNLAYRCDFQDYIYRICSVSRASSSRTNYSCAVSYAILAECFFLFFFSHFCAVVFFTWNSWRVLEEGYGLGERMFSMLVSSLSLWFVFCYLLMRFLLLSWSRWFSYLLYLNSQQEMVLSLYFYMYRSYSFLTVFFICWYLPTWPSCWSITDRRSARCRFNSSASWKSSCSLTSFLGRGSRLYLLDFRSLISSVMVAISTSLLWMISSSPISSFTIPPSLKLRSQVFAFSSQSRMTAAMRVSSSMSCSVICRSLKQRELGEVTGLSTRWVLYFNPLRVLSDWLFSFLPLCESIDMDIILYRSQSLQDAHRTEVDAVDLVRHHGDHFPRQLHLLAEGGAELLGDRLFDVGDDVLVELPGGFEVFHPFLAVAAHQLGGGLRDVNLRVYDAAEVLLVSGGVFVLLEGLYDLEVVADAFLAQVAGGVDLLVTGEALDAQHRHPHVEELVEDLRDLDQDLLPGGGVGFRVELLQQGLQHLLSLLEHAGLPLVGFLQNGKVLVQPRLGEQDLDMLSHVSIKYKNLQGFLEEGVRLPEQRLAALDIVGEEDLREGLVELLEKYQFLLNRFLILFVEILVVDPQAAKFEQLADQVAETDVDGCPQFLLLPLGDDLQGQHEQVLSLREVLISLVVLRQSRKVVHEVLELVLACVVLPLQGESAVLGCLVLESLLGVGLGEVEEGQGVVVLHLFMIDAALVEEVEAPALGLKGAVVVDILGRAFEVGVVDLRGLAETAQPLVDILAVDVAEGKHVVDDDQVLVESVCLKGGQLLEGGERPLVAAGGIAALFDVVVDLAQDAVGDEVVPALGGQQLVQQLDGLVLVHEGCFLGRPRAGELQCDLHAVLEGGLQPKEVLVGHDKNGLKIMCHSNC